MKIHLLSGFLGSGKTTAVASAAGLLLKKGIKVGVITNDQGINLVDSAFFKSLNVPYRQVVNGCFCCNYDQFDNNIDLLLNEHRLEMIFAESVGSCTDIVATLMKPLLKFRNGIDVTVSTFADIRLLLMLFNGNVNVFDEKVKYIYLKQLEEASVIVVSKADLATKQQLQQANALMDERYAGKIVLYQDSFSEKNIDHWLTTLNDLQLTGTVSSLNMDYDIYAEGESRMAWLDHELAIKGDGISSSVGFLVNNIHKEVVSRGYTIGHLKFMINGKDKMSFTSGDNEVRIGDLSVEDAAGCSLLINARVQTEPDILAAIVSGVIREAERRFQCTIDEKELASFQPAYPKPTHRLS